MSWLGICESDNIKFMITFTVFTSTSDSLNLVRIESFAILNAFHRWARVTLLYLSHIMKQ